MLQTFLNGLLIALAVEMPIGPIALLTIDRSLSRGWRAGATTGLASATALAIFSIISGLSVGIVMEALQEYRLLLRLMGAVIVLALGIRTLLRKQNTGQPSTQPMTRRGSNYSSAFAIAISNPQTMLLFAGAFATVGISQTEQTVTGIAAMTMGIFLGSLGWWLLLSVCIHHAGKRLPDVAKQWLQRGAGVLMICIGTIMLLSLVL